MQKNVCKVPYPEETKKILAWVIAKKTVDQIKAHFPEHHVDACLDVCAKNGLIERSLKRIDNIDYIQWKSTGKKVILKQGKNHWINRKYENGKRDN